MGVKLAGLASLASAVLLQFRSFTAGALAAAMHGMTAALVLATAEVAVKLVILPSTRFMLLSASKRAWS